MSSSLPGVMKGRREPQLWSLACDIAVENVIDSLNRTSVKRPLTYVRQNAYQQITAEETVVAAAPVYRWLTRQTPGVLRQLEREFVTDDHRLWPKDAPDQPQQMPTPLPQKTWQKIGERMQTELDLRDKEAGDGADALKQQVKAANRSRRIPWKKQGFFMTRDRIRMAELVLMYRARDRHRAFI